MKFCVIPAAIGAALIAIAATAPARAADDMVSFNGIAAKPGKVIPGVGQVLIPASSIEHAGDVGLRAHTHYRILKPVAPAVPPSLRPAGARPLLSEPETPASAACVYGLVPPTGGCDPNTVTQTASGGSKAIGIVDAYDNPTVIADLQFFSTSFGLPPANIKVIFCSSSACSPAILTPPKANRGWALEIALDVQWAHAMAPSAQIILVEAFSNSNADLLRAEDEAAALVAAAGGGEVSNSWGGSEFARQTKFDKHFAHSGVVFFASSGDHDGGTTAPDIEWPATSPNVVAVGGTTIVRSRKGSYRTQSAWIDTGGGLSAIYTRPPFQDAVAAQVGSARGVPDVAWDADPNSGGYVYCTAGSCGKKGGFFIVGGTSLASPSIAGMTNNAGHFRNSSTDELTALYGGLGSARFTDIISGECGNGRRGKLVNAITGWDLCTGIGAPKTAGGL